MKKILTVAILLVASTFSFAEYDENTLGKKDGYPSDCKFKERDPRRCLIAWTSGKIPSHVKIKEFYSKHGNIIAWDIDEKLLSERQTNKVNSLFNSSPIKSLIIVKNGKIAYEKYQYSLTKDSLAVNYSMTKSITALAVGKAIELGHIKSIDDEAGKYLPQLSGSVFEKITIKNLLLMASGVNYNYEPGLGDSTKTEIQANIMLGIRDENIVDYLKNYKSNNSQQGKNFNYDNKNTILLGMIIEAATGKSLPDFFGEQIWSKIGASSDFMWAGTKNNIIGAEGWSASIPRDFAKIGLLVANEGIINGEQIINKEWIKQQTTKQIKVSRIGNTRQFPDRGYGYQTHTHDNLNNIYAFEGFMGQLVMFDRKSKTFMVVHSVDVMASNWLNIYALFDEVIKEK